MKSKIRLSFDEYKSLVEKLTDDMVTIDNDLSEGISYVPTEKAENTGTDYVDFFEIEALSNHFKTNVKHVRFTSPYFYILCEQM